MRERTLPCTHVVPVEIKVGPPVLTINQGTVFMVTDERGEIDPEHELGIFAGDTRLVSYYALTSLVDRDGVLRFLPSCLVEDELRRDADGALRAQKADIIMGPMDLPSCRMVTVRDPDGNKLTLHQRKSG